MIESFDRIQTTFMANTGQVEDKEVAYIVKTSDWLIYINKNGMITYKSISPAKEGTVIHEMFPKKNILLTPLEPPPEKVVAVLRERSDSVADKVNYYRLSYGDIFEGIQLHLLAFIDAPEKIFIVSPGADPKKIAIEISGAEGLKVNGAGMLEITTKRGPITFTQPHAYQFVGEERKSVDIAYNIHKGTTYGFKLGSYDASKTLYIAPIIPAFLLSPLTP
jgi:hypothetical protein